MAEVNPSCGETNAELLARHCFQKAIAGSARHLGLALSYVEGKPPQAFELSGRNGRAIELANMTDAELEARLLSILSPGMVIAPGLVIAAAPQNDESVPTLDAKRDAALAAPAPAIGNSTVADCVEIIPPATAPEPAPATVTVAKTQRPCPQRRRPSR